MYKHVILPQSVHFWHVINSRAIKLEISPVNQLLNFFNLYNDYTTPFLKLLILRSVSSFNVVTLILLYKAFINVNIYTRVPDPGLAGREHAESYTCNLLNLQVSNMLSLYIAK